jgi:hypothetical protein
MFSLIHFLWGYSLIVCVCVHPGPYFGAIDRMMDIMFDRVINNQGQGKWAGEWPSGVRVAGSMYTTFLFSSSKIKWE